MIFQQNTQAMEQNRISIIIVLYFSKHLLYNLLPNVRKTIINIGEIILINNSDENLDEFESNDIRIIYPKFNLGYAGGINLGVGKSKYDWLLILNPDIHVNHFSIEPKHINNEIIISGFNPKMPGYSLRFPTLLSGFISIAVIDLVYSKTIDKLIHFRRIDPKVDELKVDYVSGALIFTNKKTFEKIGGFDDAYFLYYEETDFCKRASKLNIPILCTNKISFTPNAGKASSKNVDKIKIRAGILSCKRYHSKYSGKLATRGMFLLLRSEYLLMLMILAPISYIIKSFSQKKGEIAYRMKFL